MTTRALAPLWDELMQGLGYPRYGAGGTDFGAGVTTYMARSTARRRSRAST